MLTRLQSRRILWATAALIGARTVYYDLTQGYLLMVGLIAAVGIIEFIDRCYLEQEASRLVNSSKIIVYTALILVSTGLLREPIFDAALLPEEDYMNASFVASSFNFLPMQVLTGIWLAGMLLLLNTGGFMKSHISWQSMQHAQVIRIFSFVITAMLAWYAATLSYNEYYGQFYAVERLLLVLLTMLVWVNPWFIPPTYILTIMMIYQLNYPFTFAITDKTLMLETLYILSTFALLRAVVRVQTQHLILALLIAGATIYTYAGASKLVTPEIPLVWLYDSRLDNLFIANYQHGWLSNLPESFILSVANLIGTPVGEIGMNGFALAAEMGTIFFLFNRRTAVAAMIGIATLHMGIFYSTGIFFWKWITVLVMLMWVFYRLWHTQALRVLYRPAVLVAAVVMVFGTQNMVFTEPYYWFNSPINHIYHIELETIDGEINHVPRLMMEPYGLFFAQNQLSGLSREPHISNVSGTVRTYKQHKDIMLATDMEAYINEYGVPRHNPEFEYAFVTYASRVFAEPQKYRWIKWIAPPSHIIYPYYGEDKYSGHEWIKTLRVRQVTTVYENDEIRVISDTFILEIPIAPPQAPQ